MATEDTEDKLLNLLEGIDDSSESEDEEATSHVRYSIKSYGADYPVDALVKRLSDKNIVIPKFQRGYVWTLPQASRFIESLLLGLPVPAIFLSRESTTQKLLVIDGQQRLQSLLYFYDGIFRGKEFALKGVQEDFEGLTLKTLSPEDKRRLDDAILHAIVVNQEDPQNDQTGLYNLFERINTGGTPLHPQEIRACIYPGAMNELLKDLASFEKWRELYGSASARGKDQELILRFFAVYFTMADYERPLKQFLNKFMSRNKDYKLVPEAKLTALFKQTTTYAVDTLGSKAFRPNRNLNTALTEAILVGTGKRLEAGPINDVTTYTAAYRELMGNKDFENSFNGATTDVERMRFRISRATEVFSRVL